MPHRRTLFTQGGFYHVYNRGHSHNEVFREPDNYRFVMQRMEEDEYLIHLCRYIHATPVKAGLASTAEAWPYSDYAAWTASLPQWEDGHTIGGGLFRDGRRYAAFVQESLDDPARQPVELQAYLDSESDAP